VEQLSSGCKFETFMVSFQSKFDLKQITHATCLELGNRPSLQAMPILSQAAGRRGAKAVLRNYTVVGDHSAQCIAHRVEGSVYGGNPR